MTIRLGSSTSGARGAREARTLLGILRLVFGSMALLTPDRLVRRIEGPEADSPAATYAFRMFGIRTVLLGRSLLATEEPGLAAALREAPIIHASDTVTATVLTATGRVPRRTGLSLMCVSGLNTVLALVAGRDMPPEATGER